MALSFARDRKSDSDVISKAKNARKRTAIKGGMNMSALIQQMTSIANTKLAHHKDDYIIIRDKAELETYIDFAQTNGECAIDTETTGLNPLLVDIVGVCLYTPNQKACYIPINHKSFVTGVRTANQLTENEIAHIIAKFKGKWIMHDAKYDIRVMRHTLGIDLDCYWDTMLAACCINEEESHRLKDLHLKYCDSKDIESLTFDKLFNGVTFDNIPINTAYLYAAGDAIKTYELYKYQQTVLNRRTLSGPYRVFTEIEMPVLKVVCDMEDRGVMLDKEVCDALHTKYHTLRQEAQKKADKAISMYADEIETYKMKNINHKLSDPISLSSPTQLAILFYDILKMESPDKKSPRGTGEDIMKEFAKGKHKDICESILEMRSLDKLIGTYIDKMPQVALEDGRVHASYNQYGAKTGRFSSSDPRRIISNWGHKIQLTQGRAVA